MYKKGKWMPFLWTGILFIFTSLASGQAMKYVGTKATNPDGASVSQQFWPLMKIQVETYGSYEPLSLLRFNLQTIFKKWPNERAPVQVFFTGNKDSFYVMQPFGKLQNKAGNLSASGQQQLSNGINYFWIAFRPKGKSDSVSTPLLHFVSCTTGLQQYQTTWADEFSKDGPPDSANWRYEQGFVRNEENQWYQPENAFCKNGILTIEARKDSFLNPRYEAGSRDWRKNRPYIRYTSSGIDTRGRQKWVYGRWEMRARIDTNVGCWPAWWALGTEGGDWPASGEIDMMEFYRGKILANYAIATQKPNTPKWYSTATPIADLKRNNWADSFHLWRMDWDSTGIAIYLDNTLLNYQPQTSLYNRAGDSSYFPFRHPQYMLLNLAIGGINGGDPSDTVFPRKYEIDYVRVLQKVKQSFSNRAVHYSVN